MNKLYRFSVSCSINYKNNYLGLEGYKGDDGIPGKVSLNINHFKLFLKSCFVHNFKILDRFTRNFRTTGRTRHTR